MRRSPVTRRCITLALGAALLAMLGCQSSKIAMLEFFGKPKRQILTDRVGSARDAQQDAKEQFQTALEKFTAVTNYQGGELEAKYKDLNSAYERSESRADTVRKRIADVEAVSAALFKEWEKELEEYANESLRESSRRQLAQTRDRYGQVISAMRRAETSMAPVLAAFKDQVLFLKHNLNAAAIASLQDELATVQTDVAALIRQMEASIAEADAFITEMTAEQG